MQFYLAKHSDQMRTAFVKRFAPRLWTVDFARPMMAAVTAPSPDMLRVDLDFLTRKDLAGLIWTSEDRWSHPLLAYRTEKDYRGLTLSFDWVADARMKPLDSTHGSVLTIEGRDAEGVARTWYVRLWNYAEGTPFNARVTLDFDDLHSGFGPDGEAVFAGDIDRMFLSLVSGDYDETDAPLAAPISAWVELRNIKAEGSRSTIVMGDAFLPEHQLRMCSGYDDSYHQTPQRLIEQWRALGYRKFITHYVGMSHYYALRNVGDGRFEPAGGLCGSALAWHHTLARTLKGAGYALLLSLSFELFDANAPADWAQLDVSGNRALTGWEPPSTLLSPCNTQAMSWLAEIAAAFVGILTTEEMEVHLQVGEPWWWVTNSGRPCFYDDATIARWTSERGSAPPPMHDVIGERSADEKDWLDWLGVQLASSTALVRDAAQVAAGDTAFTSYLLFFAPQVLDEHAPELRRANMPTEWSWPAWDVLQLEDYDFVTTDNQSGMRRGRLAVQDILKYPLDNQQYLAGFVLNEADAKPHWYLIMEAIRDSFSRKTPETLVWAWPQIARDGFVYFSLRDKDEEADMEAFHNVIFPLDVGFDAVGGPEFSTQVATLASGHEQRNIQWANARLVYDAGVGIRSEDDLLKILQFFRARKGQAFGFLFKDPLDWTSAGLDGDITPFDQILGIGDGKRLSFPLVKTYGDIDFGEVRMITRPVLDSVRISIDGAEIAEGWGLGSTGVVEFEDAPRDGALVCAGYHFHVPVRFSTDRIDISVSNWRSGEIPSIPLVEIKE